MTDGPDIELDAQDPVIQAAIDPQWESRMDQLLAAVREGAGEHRSLQVHRERRDAPTPWRIYGLTRDELVAQMRASRRYWEGDLYEI